MVILNIIMSYNCLRTTSAKLANFFIITIIKVFFLRLLNNVNMEDQNQRPLLLFDITLSSSLSSPLKSFSNFPNHLTSFECFHVSRAGHEVTLYNPALPRGKQVPIKGTDSRVKTALRTEYHSVFKNQRFAYWKQ